VQQKGPVPFVQGQEGLNDASDPEIAERGTDEGEHFPVTDVLQGQVELSHHNADDEEQQEPQELKYLKSKDCVEFGRNSHAVWGLWK